MNKILFPGSFDPFTLGHADLVSRALKLFDHIIIAVGINEHKPGWLPTAERLRDLNELYSNEPRVSVTSYSGLTTDCAAQYGVSAILRGVRTMADYEYELQMADVNKRLTGIDTVVLFADPSLAYLSSSIVRELAHFGKDITPFLPTAYAPRFSNIGTSADELNPNGKTT